MSTITHWLWHLFPGNPLLLRVLHGGSVRLRHFWVRMGYLGALILLVLIACVSMVVVGVFKRTTKLKMKEGNDAVRNDSQFGLVGGWE